MSHIPAALVRQTVDRAGNRCEYCGLSQLGQEATFHVDHVIPVAARGPTVLANLALACVSCSLRKNAKLTAIDPDTNAEVPIFNPRTERWSAHFRWDGYRVVGLTPIGRDCRFARHEPPAHSRHSRRRSGTRSSPAANRSATANANAGGCRRKRRAFVMWFGVN
jgi:hypothetical protein